MQTTIEKLDHMGNGIGYIDGKIVFVPKTIPGDIVDIDIVSNKKNFANGKVNSFIKRAGNFEDYICPYYQMCGGCHLQGLPYLETIKYKRDRIANILNRCDINLPIEFIENEDKLNYRNKIELKLVDGKLGFYEAKSHNILEIKSCMITKDAINNFLDEIKDMQIINGEVTIRCNYNNELLISIKTSDDIRIKNDYSKYKVVGIILNDETIYGGNKFLDRVNNLFFEVSYDSFFQVNSFINTKLFDIIKDNAYGDTILDLYSGVGTLSLMASMAAKKVYAIEVIPNAVINAIKNAKINNIDNVNFILGNVEEKILKIDDKIDTVIVDPPRSGLDNITMNKIFELNPNKIIYISCETQKLSEDLKVLMNNYKPIKIYGLDMFSYTYHVETIVVLERR